MLHRRAVGNATVRALDRGTVADVSGGGPALTLASVRRVLGEMRRPAVVVCRGGSVLASNLGGASGPLPVWLSPGDRWEARLPVWVRRTPLPCIDGTTLYLLVAEESEVPVEQAHLTAWARRFRLAPRLARVAAKMAEGLSDKEIACALDLSLNTVRTYARQLFEVTRVHSRTELARAIHDARMPAGCVEAQSSRIQ